jgi:hypothetical protein
MLGQTPFLSTPAPRILGSRHTPVNDVPPVTAVRNADDLDLQDEKGDRLPELIPDNDFVVDQVEGG